MDRRTRLPTILFPRGAGTDDASQSSIPAATSPNKTPTKSTATKNKNNDDDGSGNELTPNPKHKRYMSARDYITQRHVPDSLGFPASLNEAINSAFAEEQYEAGVETIDHSRANGIIPAEHHLRILFAFSLRPTPDPITYRQTASSLTGALSAPPSLPLIHRARTLLLDLAHLHGPDRILRALSPAKIAHAGGLDAPSKGSLRATVKTGRNRSYGTLGRAKDNSPESDEDDQDGTFLENEPAAAALQKNPFLVPFPLAEASSSSSSTSFGSHLAPAVRDSWELLRTPPPGSLTEADLYRRALAAAEADESSNGNMTLNAAAIRQIALRYSARRRGRGRGGNSAAAASSSSSRVPADGFLTHEDLLRHSPAAIQRYNEIVYGKSGARDTLRTRAVNGEALVFMAPLWQAERRQIMYGSKKGKEPALDGQPAERLYDEVNALKALYGLSLAWDFPIDRKLAQSMSTAARKSTMPKEAPAVKEDASASANPPPPAKPAKTHAFFAQRFASSAPSKGFNRGSPNIGSSPPASAAGGPPSSPAGPGPGPTSASGSPSASRVARTGPQGCAEVGQALDVLFEVFAGNVLLSDRDGLCRSALALVASNGAGGNGLSGDVATTNGSAVSALGSGAPAVSAKWREMVGAAATALYEVLQLTRQADEKSAPVLDADALERGIAQRLAWADVGADAIAITEQNLRANVEEEQARSVQARGTSASLVVPLEWETEPVLSWMRALVNHFRRVASVLRRGSAKPTDGPNAETPSSSQRSSRSAASLVSATSTKWEQSLGQLLQSLSPHFFWMEIRRERLAEVQDDLEDDGQARFVDIDAKRERRVWADLMEVEAAEGEAVPVPQRAARRAREGSPEIIWVFSGGPAFEPGSSRAGPSSSMDTSDDSPGSPGYEIVSVTPSSKLRDVPMVSAAKSSSGSGSKPGGSSSNSSAQAAKDRPKLSRSDAIQVQAREWVLDWGLDVFSDLKSTRRPSASPIRTEAAADATLEDHDVRLNALLRVAEVVLGEVRRRRRGALIKFAVLMWARRCVPPLSVAAAGAGVGGSQQEGAVPSQGTSAMDVDEDEFRAPTSSAIASAYLGTQTSESSTSTSASTSSTVRQALLDKLDSFCTDAAASAQRSLLQVRVWEGALRCVWEEAIGLGIVPATNGRAKGFKSEMGKAVNVAFTMEMERLLQAIGVEVQGLGGTVMGWSMYALEGGAL
ncbi:unnamed protein product [Tilletia laevis]|uniref:Uncharacterized protein n=2 Tax=Tilletia TaxID=13289 RepID=A0A177VFC8_9BASI|nr:hypothetical protein CF336_g2243 [Tilletia laevis]KAE8261440.1 hypothetical protein A4X03_0g3249 [Tilletia caries]CAD6924749.1 unnamed protein product [Tilletia controversa]KAE8206982.1 hypothetical protein CF335_g1480 [Tilletia laevis]CAD6887154.1 unnamed protein product [Tilletia caries]